MNSPSGGMKVMLRSASNLPSLTHWWKVQSSISMPLPALFAATELCTPAMLPLPVCAPGPLASRSISSLSFMPKRHSGMPLRKLFILISPQPSACSTWPLELYSTFTDSITSMNISFFL
jgi:hypothetical protein